MTCMVVCIAPFIRHQQHMIRRLPQCPVVLPFIQKTCLVGACLRCQRHGGMVPRTAHGIRRPPYKGGKGVPVLRQNIFEVDVQSLIAFFLHEYQQALYQPLCIFTVVHHRMDQPVVEISVAPERSQGEYRLCAESERLPDHPFVIPVRRRQQFPFRRESVGEDRKLRKERQSLLQHHGRNERIGISAHGNSPCGIPDEPVDQERLPYRKPVRILQLIVIDQLLRVYPEHIGDAVHTVPRPYHIDFHKMPSHH